MHVRLTHIDGKLPNLALMRLAHYHRSRGDTIYFTKDIDLSLFEQEYDRIYGSSIFTMSRDRVERFRKLYPRAFVGGTGTDTTANLETVVPDIQNLHDYSIYPDFSASIGFLQRGCRLKCKFCVVPTKEGRPVHNMTVNELWRGDPNPKNLHILDNDFFSVPTWQDRIDEIRAGGFRVCLTQGINVRLITEDAARALASIEYRDTKFKRRRLYTAWDSIGHERVFFRGVDRLVDAGIPEKHVMAYMLIGYDKRETWEAIHYRFDKMVERGIKPYPMVYDPARKDLKRFQRWAVTGLYRAFPFSEYGVKKNASPTQSDQNESSAERRALLYEE